MLIDFESDGCKDDSLADDVFRVLERAKAEGNTPVGFVLAQLWVSMHCAAADRLAKAVSGFSESEASIGDAVILRRSG